MTPQALHSARQEAAEAVQYFTGKHFIKKFEEEVPRHLGTTHCSVAEKTWDKSYSSLHRKNLSVQKRQIMPEQTWQGRIELFCLVQCQPQFERSLPQWPQSWQAPAHHTTNQPQAGEILAMSELIMMNCGIRISPTCLLLIDFVHSSGLYSR